MGMLPHSSSTFLFHRVTFKRMSQCDIGLPPPVWTTPCPHKRRQARKPGRPWIQHFNKKILFSWKYVLPCDVELGNPERGEMWPAPVVSPGYAVKLLLASRVPQHQADLLSIHAGQVDQGDEGDGKLLTILAVRRPRQLDFDKSIKVDLTLFSSQGSRHRWSSCTQWWKSPCNTSGSAKISPQHHCPQSPPWEGRRKNMPFLSMTILTMM